MCKAYGDFYDQAGWAASIDISTESAGNSSNTIIGAAFASHENILNFHERITDTFSDLRFKDVNYKWIKDASDWNYAHLDTLKDGDIL